jgi:cytochrome P450
MDRQYERNHEAQVEHCVNSGAAPAAGEEVSEPVVRRHGYDPLDPEVVSDPYPTFNRLRDEGPVFMPELDHYIIPRYDDVEQVLLDRDSRRRRVVAAQPVCPAAQDVLAAGYHRVPTSTTPIHRATARCASRCSP